MAFTYLRTIRFQETDAAGVVYFANLLNICHEAYEASLIQAKINLKTFFNNPQFAIPIIHADIDFFQPINCGEKLVIQLEPIQVSENQFKIEYQITRLQIDRSVVAKATTQHVCIHPQSRQRQILPEAMMSWLSHNLVEKFLYAPDTVVTWKQGKVFFFKGDEYVSFDLYKNYFDWGYPQKISQSEWFNFPEQFHQGIDAGVIWADGKAFFFRGNEYIRYDLYKNQVEFGYPQKLDNGNWMGWPEHFYQGIDAAVLWNNGKAYFFKGDEYIRYDIYQEMMDPDYPKKIKDNWQDLPDYFSHDLSAVIRLNANQAYFFHQDEYLGYNTVEKRSFFQAPRKTNEHWFYSSCSLS